MTIWDWLIVLVLNGAIILYGFYLSRGTSSSSEWFLGGRSLPWWGLGLSMFATSVDNADLVSITGFAYNQGLHILTVFTLATVLGCCLSAFFIVPVMYRAGFYTNAEFLETRFSSSLRLFSALIQIQYRTAMLGLMIWSIYLMLQGVADLQPWQAWSLIVLLVILTGSYTVLGGLASVVWTDALQSLIIMAGAVCIFGAVWMAVGGWTGMQEKLDSHPEATWHAEKGWIGLNETQRNDTAVTQPLSNWLHIGSFKNPADETPVLVMLVGWLIVGLGYYSVNHTQTMRLMGARSLWDMKIAALFGGALGIPITIMIVMLGVFGRVLYPELTTGEVKADSLFPLLAQEYLSVGFKGLVVAGIVSATVSTFDSMGSALSALFTRDIYARWIKQDGTDAHYLKVSRFATIGVLLLGFLYLPFIINQKNMLNATLALIPVFVTPLFTIYMLGALTRVHRKSGLIGLLVGGAYGVLCFLLRQEYLPDFLPGFLYSKWYAYLWSVGLTSLSMFLTTLILGRASEVLPAVPQTDNKNNWLTNSREELGEIKEHPFKDKIPLVLQPRWLALILILFSTWLILGFFW